MQLRRVRPLPGDRYHGEGREAIPEPCLASHTVYLAKMSMFSFSRASHHHHEIIVPLLACWFASVWGRCRLNHGA